MPLEEFVSDERMGLVSSPPFLAFPSFWLLLLFCLSLSLVYPLPLIMSPSFSSFPNHPLSFSCFCLLPGNDASRKPLYLGCVLAILTLGRVKAGQGTISNLRQLGPWLEILSLKSNQKIVQCHNGGRNKRIFEFEASLVCRMFQGIQGPRESMCRKIKTSTNKETKTRENN